MVQARVGIRLATDGGAEVKNDFADMRKAGVGAMDAVADAADKTAARGAQAADRYKREFERANADIEAAERKRANASAKIAAILPKTAMQMRVDGAVGTGFAQPEGSAKSSAAAFTALIVEQQRAEAAALKLKMAIDPLWAAEQQLARALDEVALAEKAGVLSATELAAAQARAQQQFERTREAVLASSSAIRMGDDADVVAYTRAQDQLAAATAKVRAAVDPAWAAQQRYNREIAEARMLIANNAISLDEYCIRQRQLREALDETTRAQLRANDGVNRNGMVSVQAGQQVQDFFIQVQGGQSILVAATQQLSQLGFVMQGATGMAGKFAAFMTSGWGTAVLIGASVLGVLISALSDSDDAAKQAAEGLRKFQDRQSDIGNFIDATTGRLKEQNRTLITNAILTRQARIDANSEVVREGQKAAFNAAYRVGVKRGGPVDPLTGRVGLTDDPAITKLIRDANGDVTKLDAGLQALGKRRPDLRGVILEISNAAGQSVNLARENETLGKEIDQLSGKTVAQGKATSGLVEKQVALATATTPLEHARAKYNLVLTEGAAAEKAGGKALDEYRAKLTGAAQAVNSAEAAEKASTASRRDGSKAMREQAKDARELQQMLESLQDSYDPRAALKRRFDAEMASIAKLQSAGMLNDNDADRYVRSAWRNSAIEEMRRDADEVAAGLEQLSPLIREAAIVTNDQFNRSLETGLAKIDAITASVSTLSPLMRELKPYADDILNPRNWDNWGDAGKSVLREIKAQFIELALTNPIKNFLFGESNATLLGGGGSSSLLGKLISGASGLLGGGKGYAPGAGSGDVGGGLWYGSNATGTEYWGGGATWVAENGPELINLPRGARVTPAGETRRMLSAANDSGMMEVRVIKGDLFDVEVRRIAAPIAAEAGQRAMIGGASEAQRQIGRRARRQLAR